MRAPHGQALRWPSCGAPSLCLPHSKQSDLKKGARGDNLDPFDLIENDKRMGIALKVVVGQRGWNLVTAAAVETSPTLHAHGY